MEEYDNLLEFYDEGEFTVKRIRDMRYRKYLARICGEDPVFGFRRKFLRYRSADIGSRNARYLYGDLPEGVYETSVRYYRPDEKKPVSVDRKICLLYNGDFYNYPYEALDRRTVLEYVDDIRDGTFNICNAADSL